MVGVVCRQSCHPTNKSRSGTGHVSGSKMTYPMVLVSFRHITVFLWDIKHIASLRFDGFTGIQKALYFLHSYFR